MTSVLDCTTCGGPMAADRRCCPHCHCKNGHLKRLALAAALSVGAGCGGSAPKYYPEPDLAYGPAMQFDASTPDLATPDLAEPTDGGEPND